VRRGDGTSTDPAVDVGVDGTAPVAVGGKGVIVRLRIGAVLVGKGATVLLGMG
jgi:hypothetical protein